MTITEFLNARLDEDERAARFAFADHNDAGPEWAEVRSGAVSVGDHEDELITFDAGISRHIVRQDPARALREITAKRAIFALHEPNGDYCSTCLESESDLYGAEYEEAPCLNVRHLAAVYSDHPDYRQEWAP